MPFLPSDSGGNDGGMTRLAEKSLYLAELLKESSLRSGAVSQPTGSQYSELQTWKWSTEQTGPQPEPHSPGAADTPRALVPAACFPPSYPGAFASYSEQARPGVVWGDDLANTSVSLPAASHVADIVASLGALSMPSAAASADGASLQAAKYRRDYNRHVGPWSLDVGCVTRRSGVNNGNLSWEGTLPPRCVDESAGYSAKVFLGGLPWDINEPTLLHALADFYPVRVDWPTQRAGVGGAGGGGVGDGGEGTAPRGYVYVTLESERRVHALLRASRRDRHDWYYRIATRKMRSKEVQVIPWAVSDSAWVSGTSARLEPNKTVFVGALHGMITASALAFIMDQLFGGVIYAGIDMDKSKYPIGSGRVTFNDKNSYIRAISSAFIDIHTDKFSKRVQVDPYLEDSMCSKCNLQQGPYFCRDPTCFTYFCRLCWGYYHMNSTHTPLMRNSKGTTAASQSVSGSHNGSASYNGSGPYNGSGSHSGPRAPAAQRPKSIPKLQNGLRSSALYNGMLQSGSMGSAMMNGPSGNGRQNGELLIDHPPNGPMTNGFCNGTGSSKSSESDHSLYSGGISAFSYDGSEGSENAM